MRAATQRSSHRIPAVSWIHSNGAALSRSSQPKTGITDQQCPEDEKLLMAHRRNAVEMTRLYKRRLRKLKKQQKRLAHELQQQQQQQQNSQQLDPRSLGPYWATGCAGKVDRGNSMRSNSSNESDGSGIEIFAADCVTGAGAVGEDVEVPQRRNRMQMKPSDMEDSWTEVEMLITGMPSRASATESASSSSTVSASVGSSKSRRDMSSEAGSSASNAQRTVIPVPAVDIPPPRPRQVMSVLVAIEDATRTPLVYDSKPGPSTVDNSELSVKHYAGSRQRPSSSAGAIFEGDSTSQFNVTVNKQLLRIVDCRPLLSAQGNRMMGKGFENIGRLGGSEQASIHFAGIGNIHVMR